MGLFSLFGKKNQDPDDTDVPVKPRRSRAKAQDDEPMDPILPEKKRARRRLIGATALVLAAIIGLPMVFDSAPKPLADDIAIQIPPRDKSPVATANPMPLPPSHADADMPRADAAPEHAPVTEPAPAKPEPVKPEAAKADPVGEKSAEKVAEKPAAKPTDKSADKTEQVEKPAAKVADKPADKASAKDKDKSRYLVQVAAVTTKAKGEELVNRLKKAGIKAYWQKVATKDGERFRVRVGPLGSRDEADKLRQRLVKMGLSGSVQPI